MGEEENIAGLALLICKRTELVQLDLFQHTVTYVVYKEMSCTLHKRLGIYDTIQQLLLTRNELSHCILGLLCSMHNPIPQDLNFELNNILLYVALCLIRMQFVGP